MTNIILPSGGHPTVKVTEPSSGHVVPLAVAVLLFVVSVAVSVWFGGAPPL